MAYHTSWTNEEIVRLTIEYPRSPWRKLPELFPFKSRSGILHKALRLGLRREVPGWYDEHSYVFQPTEFELGYLAGFTDGEGSIGVHKRAAQASPSPVLWWANTDKRVMEYVASLIGAGKTLTMQRFSNNPRQKDAYRLGLREMMTIDKVLKVLGPRLVIKRRNAELVRELIQLKLERGPRLGTGKGMRPISPREADIHQELKALNRKGP